MNQGKSIHDLKIGEFAEISKTITDEIVQEFARVSGDFNPLHLDQAYAEKTPFKGRIAHGALSIALLSNVLGNLLPGPGTIYLSHEIKFLAPVRIGDTITVRVEVVELLPEKNRAKFRTTCTNQEGITVVDGFAWAMPPRPGL
ncbi:MAG: MaoC family dehydratase [Desulfobacterota bacterium]|nr:MaoC family dehydratase [Thermodesulfobacteriota bacterium]